MPLLRSFGFGWRGGYNDGAPTALDAARLLFRFYQFDTSAVDEFVK
jgi:hypothetical protein